MAACPPLVFNGVSSAAWESLKAEAAEAGVTVNSDAGTLSKSGFTVGWNYNTGDSTLTITCTKAPFFFKCETINAKIRQVVEGRLADRG
jgi:hypothetical protein